MTMAIVSLSQIWEDKEANLRICEEYIRVASNKEVDLIIFPEMTLTGFSTNIENIAESESTSESIAKFRSLARLYDIAIIFGIVVKDNKKALNKSIFLDNNGVILGKYAKIHPFSFSGEDKYFNAGNDLTIIKFSDFNIGLSICYDLRFPELYTALAKNSDMIINVANWPGKRVDHWNTLLKARAIENQLFIVGVNRIGSDGNNLEYEESSNIYDANGKIVTPEIFQNMKIYKIHKKHTVEFKNQFNTINDRKVEFYKGVI